MEKSVANLMKKISNCYLNNRFFKNINEIIRKILQNLQKHYNIVFQSKI